MVYAIDKLDGSVVSLCADFVTLKQVNDDYLVEFTKIVFDGEDGNGDRKVVTKTVGAYYLGNTIGFREVAGITDEDLEQMFREDMLSINEQGEYCAKEDGENGEEIMQ